MNKIRIRLKAYDHMLLDKSTEKIVMTAKNTGALVLGPIPMPTKKTIYTVNRSVHVDKKSREQFQIKVHKRIIDLLNSSTKTVDSLMKLDMTAGVDKEDIQRGMVLAKPGSITPHTKFKASVYVLKKDEGGRHTPFFKGYRPQFYFRTTDVTGNVILPEGTEMVMPGDNVDLEIELITPIAMEKELRFAIREGGHTVGAGVVTEIKE